MSLKSSLAVGFRKHLKAVETRTLDHTREIAQAALDVAARTSPQKTGRFASNWRLAIGQPKANNYRPAVSRGQRATNSWFQEGDDPAVSRALNGLGSKLSGLRLGDKVFLSTAAVNPETGDNYAWDIEAGIMRFRSVNPSGGRVLVRALAAARKRARQIKARGK